MSENRAKFWCRDYLTLTAVSGCTAFYNVTGQLTLHHLRCWLYYTQQVTCTSMKNSRVCFH